MVYMSQTRLIRLQLRSCEIKLHCLFTSLLCLVSSLGYLIKKSIAQVIHRIYRLCINLKRFAILHLSPFEKTIYIEPIATTNMISLCGYLR